MDRHVCRSYLRQPGLPVREASHIGLVEATGRRSGKKGASTARSARCRAECRYRNKSGASKRECRAFDKTNPPALRKHKGKSQVPPAPSPRNRALAWCCPGDGARFCCAMPSFAT
ncbi:hypothetical protein D556_0401 [Bordetella holmesii 41130]|nr:hypothetical protein D558_0400 [Bordetella holmesii 44057]EWM48577.1 hypothetical protein D556_0401 [Bordetella holmesii 41130]EWM49778.1 hypothetical protein D555_0404 [Bordetella holmesii 35009]